MAPDFWSGQVKLPPRFNERDSLIRTTVPSIPVPVLVPKTHQNAFKILYSVPGPWRVRVFQFPWLYQKRTKNCIQQENKID
jgi:hypothetical protein